MFMHQQGQGHTLAIKLAEEVKQFCIILDEAVKAAEFKVVQGEEKTITNFSR